MKHLSLDVEALALLGWRLHPASRHTRAACFKGATDQATANLEQLDRWSAQYPGCNWRVVMEGSGIWALDIDVPGPDHAADGVAALRSLVEKHGPLPRRPTLRTGGGGVVLFFRYDGEPITGETGTPCPGLDPRRGRLSVTVPPSTHIGTRRPYRWIVAPWEMELPSAPGWLLELVKPKVWDTPAPPQQDRPEPTSSRRRRYAMAALRHASERVTRAPPGQRNSTLNREAFALFRFVEDGSLDAQDVAADLTFAAKTAGLVKHEILATLKSAFRIGARA